MGGEALWELVKVFLAALFASALTHLLTHRRFIQGRWWERKADAYSDIIGALVNMRLALRGSLNVMVKAERMEGRGESIPEDVVQSASHFSSKFGEARDRIERAAIEGDYIISSRVSEALSELLGKFPGHVEGSADVSELKRLVQYWDGATKSCLEVVRAEARSDLSVKWHSWF